MEIEEMNEFELLGQVAKRCMEITENTKADVFFKYYAHIKCYDIDFSKNGWNKDKNFINISDAEYTNKDNLINSLKKLDEIEKEIKEEK